MTTPSPQIRRNLSVNLAQQSPSRLIELCLLYRVHPDQSTDFPTRLNAEIARRYTEAELRNGDTEYAVLQKFSHEFKSPIPYAHQQLMEMSASVNRDIWFSNNESQFKTFLENQDILNWLVEQSDILGKCLNNRHALKWIAQSRKASTAILTHRTAVNQWKQADGLWSIWQYQQAGMEVLAQSRELVNYVLGYSIAWNGMKTNRTAVTALAGNAVAMEAICANSSALTSLVTNSSTWAILLNSQTAMNVVVESERAMEVVAANAAAMRAIAENTTLLTVILNHRPAFNLVLASVIAMREIAGNATALNAILSQPSRFTALLASSTAMSAVAANDNAITSLITNTTWFNKLVVSPTAMSAVVKSTTARNRLIANNSAFQEAKSTLWAMVKQHWRKKVTQAQDRVSNANSAVLNPHGLVFAYIGYRTPYSGAVVSLTHPGGIVARHSGDSLGSSANEIGLNNANGGNVVSFNGCTFQETNSDGYVYCELWAPPE